MIMEVFVDAGAGINGQVAIGQSALEYVVYGNSTEMVLLIEELGASLG